MIIVLFFLKMSIIPGFAQLDAITNGINQLNPNRFEIIDVKKISTNYILVSCRQWTGRTIQFQVGGPKIIGLSKTTLFPLGVVVFTDFNSGTLTKANDNTIKYKIVKPTLSGKCCSISKIEFSKNYYPTDFIIANKDTANGLTYFTKNSSSPSSIPGIILKTGQSIYQAVWNEKRYALLLPNYESEIVKNVFYSFELNYMTHDAYNSLPKRDTTTNSGNTGNVISLPSIDSNQVEISTIMNGQNITMGFISINALSDVECSINIYNPTDHKLLFNSSQLRTFELLPGKYDIEISGVTLVNLYVFKGKSTRIKSGTLNITSPSLWTLYDSSKVKTMYTSSLPKKVEFPRRIYQLEINGSVHRIEIKDGETLNFSDSSSQPQTQKLSTSINEKQWVITQNLLAKGATGKLFLNLPKEAETVITISQPVTERQVSYSLNDHAFSLVPGIYDVTLSGSKVKGVPIQKGMDTRIKAGVLNVVATGTWTLFDEKKDRQIYYSISAKKIGLPIGTYQMEINGTMQLVVIKDGETVDF